MPRTAGVLPAIVMVAVSVAVAQQQGGTAAPQQQSRAIENTRTGPMTLSGCLQANRGVHTLLRQDTSQTFILIADPGELARNTGRQVKVVATELPPKGTRPPDDLPRLEVRSFEVLSQDCATNTAPAAPAATSGAATPSQKSVETAPYGYPGSAASTPAPVGSGTGQNINGRAEGAPSPGSGDPRNLSPSPQDVPVNPPETDTGKTTSGRKQKKKEEPKTPPQ